MLLSLSKTDALDVANRVSEHIVSSPYFLNGPIALLHIIDVKLRISNTIDLYSVEGVRSGSIIKINSEIVVGFS